MGKYRNQNHSRETLPEKPKTRLRKAEGAVRASRCREVA